jgi:hypothetical protein
MTTTLADATTSLQGEHSAADEAPSTALVTPMAPPEEAPALHLPASACYDGPADLAQLREWCEWLAESTMLPEIYRGNPANVAVAALRAKSLNIPFFVGLNEIFVTEDGGIGMTALLTNYLMVRAGCKVIVVRSDSEACLLTMTRPDRPGEVLHSEWTINEAVVAGLSGVSEIWNRFPKDSLYARAVARLGRRHAPDLTLGMAYTRDELADMARSKAAEKKTVVDGIVVLPDGLDKLLKTLEAKDLTATACRALYSKAGKQGWLPLICTPDGRTVEQVIFDRGDLIAIREQDAAAPTDEEGFRLDVLDCGCGIEEYLLTGSHKPKCSGRPLV